MSETQEVTGFRSGLLERLTANFPGHWSGRTKREMQAARVGYLSTLYVLRMMSQAPAYCRSTDISKPTITLASRKRKHQAEGKRAVGGAACRAPPSGFRPFGLMFQFPDG